MILGESHKWLGISLSWLSLVVGVLSLGPGIHEVLSSKVHNFDIYNCIGSTFEKSTNGNATAFLSVVGCGCLRGFSTGGSVVVSS
jgi:hypothetical protein